MKRILFLVFLFVATVVFVVSVERVEKPVPPIAGSLEYINDALICALYYREVEDVASSDAAAFEAVWWASKEKVKAMNVQEINEYIQSEITTHLSSMDDVKLIDSEGARRVLMFSLINRRACDGYALRGLVKLIEESDFNKKGG